MSIPHPRTITALAVLAAATLLTTACSTPSSEPAAASGTTGGEIVVGQTADVNSLDPIIDNSLQGINAYDTLYDQLTEVLRDGSVGPRIATEWTSNDDATVWDFTLRDDILFHDGTPLTADDVIFTFEQVKTNPASRNTRYLANLTSMEVLEGNVLRFNLDTPFANWPRQMTLLSIVPKAAYEAAGGSEGFARNPVGSGPYTFVSYTSGVELVVQKNPDYWGDPATLDKITFVPVTTDEARVSGVQSGSLDLALIPPSQVSALDGSGIVDVRSVGSNQTMYLGFNSSEGPTGDPLIREAISLAVDRQAIVDTILGGLGDPANQMSSPANFGFDDGRDPLEYDPVKAADLLDQAGYAGEPIKLQYALDGWIPLGSQVAQAVGGFLEEAGMTVEMEGVDAASFTLMSSQRAYQGVYFSAYGPSYLDAQIILGSGIGPLAIRYYDSPQIDELYNLQISSSDEAARAGYIADIWDVIQENTFFAPLYNPTFSYAVNPNLNWEPISNGSLFFEGATLSQ
jgi:peptide/nickel transport system substrate-binding protein